MKNLQLLRNVLLDISIMAVFFIAMFAIFQQPNPIRLGILISLVGSSLGLIAPLLMDDWGKETVQIGNWLGLITKIPIFTK